MTIQKQDQFFTTEYEVVQWLELHKIRYYHVLPDLRVNVAGDVLIKPQYLRHISNTLPVQFAEVLGSFSVFDCHLISLLGSPHTVGKDFDCSANPLASLVGGPKIVKGHYSCFNTNTLESLEGAPYEIGEANNPNSGNFICYGGIFTSFEHGPRIVHGDWDSGHNTNINCLLHAPEYVGGDFFVGDANVERIWDMPTRMNPNKIFTITTDNELENLSGTGQKDEFSFFHLTGEEFNQHVGIYKEQKLLNEKLPIKDLTPKFLHKI